MPLCAPRPCATGDGSWKTLQQDKVLRLQKRKGNDKNYRIIHRKHAWTIAHATTESAIRNDYDALNLFLKEKDHLAPQALKELMTMRSTSLKARRKSPAASATEKRAGGFANTRQGGTVMWKAASVACVAGGAQDGGGSGDTATAGDAPLAGNLQQLLVADYDGQQQSQKAVEEAAVAAPPRAAAESNRLNSMQEAVYDPQLAFTYCREGRNTELRRIVAALKSREAVVSMRDDQQQTCLHIATLAGDLSIVSFLISLGSDVNAADKARWTPLHCACDSGFLDLVEFLVKAGASVNTLSDSFTIPLHYLVRKGTNDELWERHRRAIKIMLDEGANVNAQDYFGRTLLHGACSRSRDARCVQFLIEEGAEVNIADDFGFTPLHLVVQLGDMTLVKLLLSHGADPRLKSKEGTATEIAEMCRHTAIHAKLVKQEAKPAGNVHSAFSAPHLTAGLPKGSSMPNVATAATPAHDPKAFRSFDELNSLSLQGSDSTAATSYTKQLSNAKLQEKRRRFGLAATEIFVEAYDCEAKETRGVLYVWQHNFVFSTATTHSVIIISKRKVQSRSIELITKSKDQSCLLSGLTDRDAVYNLLCYLHARRDQPAPILEGGLAIHQMLGAIKYPEEARQFKKKAKDKLKDSELLIERFHCTLWSKGRVQMANAGRLYLTHLSLTFIAKSGGFSSGFNRSVVHIALDQVQDIRKREDGLEITTADQSEPRFFDRFREVDVNHLCQLLTFHWHSVLQKSVTPFVLVLGANTAIGIEAVRYLTVANVDVRAAVVEGMSKSYFDCSLTRIPPEEEYTKELATTGAELVSVDLEAPDAQQKLQTVFVGAEKVLICTSMRDLLPQTRCIVSSLETHLASDTKTVKHVVFIDAHLPVTSELVVSVREAHPLPEPLSQSVAADQLVMAAWRDEAEEMIKGLGSLVAYNILRVGIPMQLIPSNTIITQSQLFLPFGKGRVRWIDLADVAKVATVLLSTSRQLHPNQTFHLQGPESVDGEALASQLSEVLETRIMFAETPDKEYMNAYLNERGGGDVVQAVTEVLAIVAASAYAAPSEDLSKLIGQEQTSLRVFTERNTAKFRSEYRMYFSQEEKAALYSVFSAMAPTGQLTLEGFCLSLGPVLGNTALAETLFGALDLKKTGLVEFEEYMHVMSVLIKSPLDERLGLVFQCLEEEDAHEVSEEAICQLLPSLVEECAGALGLEAQFFASLMDEVYLDMTDGVRGVAVSMPLFKKGMMRNRCRLATLGKPQQVTLNTPLRGEEHDAACDDLQEADDGSQWANERKIPILFGQPEWELVTTIMIGIKQTCSVPDEQMAFSARFEHETRVSLVPGGNRSVSSSASSTLSSSLPSVSSLEEAGKARKSSSYGLGGSRGGGTVWEFRSFAPTIFFRIRQVLGVSNEDYIKSLGPERLLSHLLLGRMSSMTAMRSTGRSGSIFFRSQCGRFFIKTIPVEEEATFKKVLKSYYYYLHEKPDTLLARFYGLYRMRAGSSGSWISFVVMENVFGDGNCRIDEIYDLKGSTVNRHTEVDPDTTDLSTVALKDNDFHHVISLGHRRQALFLQQVECDIRWMESHNICDYSLLVGLHFKEQPEQPNLRESTDSNAGQEEEDESSSAASGRCKLGGGVLSEDGSTVYYLGIIDILTEFNFKKRGEQMVKSIIHDAQKISAMPPQPYRRRYMNYVAGITS